MGLTAENLAVKYSSAARSRTSSRYRVQRRARRAIDDGRFEAEILPVEARSLKGPPVRVRQRRVPPRDQSGGLAALPAVFLEGGTVTAGNSSGRNDGAAVTWSSCPKRGSAPRG